MVPRAGKSNVVELKLLRQEICRPVMRIRQTQLHLYGCLVFSMHIQGTMISVQRVRRYIALEED
jgi:hypothetical protein